MKSLMVQTQRFFADTELEAQALVAEQKREHGSYVKATSITKRTKHEVDFFIVVVTIEFARVQDLLVLE